MDEEEIAALASGRLQKTATYDTFGARNKRKAQEESLLALKERPTLSMCIPVELIAPITDTLGRITHDTDAINFTRICLKDEEFPGSVGIRLLRKMGWRLGRGIGKQNATTADRQQSKWGEMPVVGPRNTELVVLPQKNNVFGLGFDPFQV